VKNNTPKDSIFHAQTSIAPIKDELERGAASIGGNIIFEFVTDRKSEKKGAQGNFYEPGSVLVLLSKTHIAKGERVDDVLVGSLRELVHNRYKLKHGHKVGLLIAQGDLLEHERRALEKAKSQKIKDRQQRKRR
jgi:hypothetical protein